MDGKRQKWHFLFRFEQFSGIAFYGCSKHLQLLPLVHEVRLKCWRSTTVNSDKTSLVLGSRLSEIENELNQVQKALEDESRNLKTMSIDGLRTKMCSAEALSLTWKNPAQYSWLRDAGEEKLEKHVLRTSEIEIKKRRFFSTPDDPTLDVCIEWEAHYPESLENRQFLWSPDSKRGRIDNRIKSVREWERLGHRKSQSWRKVFVSTIKPVSSSLPSPCLGHEPNAWRNSIYFYFRFTIYGKLSRLSLRWAGAGIC